MLFLINLQKTETCLMQSTAEKAICSYTSILTVLTGFCPLLNGHLNDRQKNRWLYLSSSPWRISLLCDLFWKRRGPKNFFYIGINNRISLTSWWFVKYFFAPNSPIFRIRLAEKRQEREHTQMQSVMRLTQKQ